MGPASVGEKLAAKQWGSCGGRTGTSGAETDAGEPEGLSEPSVRHYAPENQRRGVHHLTLPSKGWEGGEWQDPSCTCSQAGTTQCTVNWTNEAIQLLPPEHFLKTKQSTDTLTSACPGCPQGAQQTNWKGKGLHTWAANLKALSPQRNHTHKGTQHNLLLLLNTSSVGCCLRPGTTQQAHPG